MQGQEVRPGVILDVHGNGYLIPKRILRHDGIEPTPEAVKMFAVYLAEALFDGLPRSVAAKARDDSGLGRRLRRLAVEVLDAAAGAVQTRIGHGETRH